MNRTKLIVSALIITASMFMNCGCQKSPESQIVVHKDMDKMIDEASNNNEDKVTVEELKNEEEKRTENYKAEINNESLGVTVHIDAEVDVPETDKLSVFRVKKRDFTEKDAENVKNFLIGDEIMYDACAASEIKTKSMIESEIGGLRSVIEEYKDKPGREDYVNEYQQELDELQQEYENAPDSIDFSEYPADLKFKSVAEMANGNEFLDFWEWQNKLDGRDVIYNITGDGKTLFYVQNNPDHGNKINYLRIPSNDRDVMNSVNYHISSLGGVLPVTTPMGFINNNILTKGYGIDSSEFKKIPDISADLSLDDAKKKAEDFLSAVGLNDFAFYEGDKYSVLCEPVAPYYQESYILKYYRNIDGGFFNQASGGKYSESGDGESFRKQFWGEESVELYINDAGIVEMAWNEPVEVTETVVDNASMKPFDEIKETFEKMLPIVSATEYESKPEINIDRVSLSYSRISEKDDFESGLVVPVWAFYGTNSERTDDNFKPFYQVQMSINAIDGSVIDSSLGY